MTATSPFTYDDGRKPLLLGVDGVFTPTWVPTARYVPKGWTVYWAYTADNTPKFRNVLDANGKRTSAPYVSINWGLNVIKVGYNQGLFFSLADGAAAKMRDALFEACNTHADGYVKLIFGDEDPRVWGVLDFEGAYVTAQEFDEAIKGYALAATAEDLWDADFDAAGLPVPWEPVGTDPLNDPPADSLAEVEATHLTGFKTYDPASMLTMTGTSTTLTVTGAQVGDAVSAGFTPAVPAGVLVSGSVTAEDTVTVSLFNTTVGTVNLASGTLRADVFTS